MPRNALPPRQAVALSGGNGDVKFPLYEWYFVLNTAQFGFSCDTTIRPIENAVDALSLSERGLSKYCRHSRRPTASPPGARPQEPSNTSSALRHMQQRTVGGKRARDAHVRVSLYILLPRAGNLRRQERGANDGHVRLHRGPELAPRNSRKASDNIIEVGLGPAGGTPAAPVAESSPGTSTAAAASTAEDGTRSPPPETSSAARAASIEQVATASASL